MYNRYVIEQHTDVPGPSRTDPASHTNYRWLTSPEKTDRLRAFHSRSKVCQQKIRRS